MRRVVRSTAGRSTTDPPGGQRPALRRSLWTTAGHNIARTGDQVRGGGCLGFGRAGSGAGSEWLPRSPDPVASGLGVRPQSSDDSGLRSLACRSPPMAASHNQHDRRGGRKGNADDNKNHDSAPRETLAVVHRIVVAERADHALSLVASVPDRRLRPEVLPLATALGDGSGHRLAEVGTDHAARRRRVGGPTRRQPTDLARRTGDPEVDTWPCQGSRHSEVRRCGHPPLILGGRSFQSGNLSHFVPQYVQASDDVRKFHGIHSTKAKTKTRRYWTRR
jgi:hypothetical protein